MGPVGIRYHVQVRILPAMSLLYKNTLVRVGPFLQRFLRNAASVFLYRVA